jgi:hypothetical protein
MSTLSVVLTHHDQFVRPTGHRWRKAVAKVKARRPMTCTLCDAPIDLTLSYPHPMSFSVDHTLALASGGDPYDQRNLEPAHLIHNIQKSDHANWHLIDTSNWITGEDP